VPLVDLDARSTAWCEQAGPVETAKLNPLSNGKPDTTHLDAAGSAVFAELVADELRRAVPAFAAWLRKAPATDVVRDIEYACIDGAPLLLDAHVPDGAGPFPVAILVHGGGWSRGDKHAVPAGDSADISPMFGTLSAAQFAWFSINYRLAPEHRWPACLDDVQTAIRWVKAHAHEFKGDPRRIALFGHSAGGHLVCLAATLADKSTRVQAVVGYAAVTDLVEDTVTRGGVSSSLQQLFGLAPRPTREGLAVLREDSPITQVRAGQPAFLLVHGDADKTVPWRQSLAFQAKVRAAGGRCDLITIPGASHALDSWEDGLPGYDARIVAWLRGALEVSP
jgi:alpha-L-fucosidase 2